MRKKYLLLSLVIIFAAPMHSLSQSYEDFYNAGYILGATIRQAVQNSNARKAEQERIEREKLEADRAYELEQQRIANERYAIQQREAEARRVEEERLRMAQESSREEEERLRSINSASTRFEDNSVNENREENKSAHVLTKDNLVKFLTDDGQPVCLGIDEITETYIDEDRLFNPDIDKFVELVQNSSIHDKDQIVRVIQTSKNREQEIKNMSTVYDEVRNEILPLICPDAVKTANRCALFYNNSYCDRELRLICNKVSIRVKYVDDENEQRITDACSICLPPKTYGDLEWSDVFFNISDTQQIERIKVQFIDTQIK